MKYMYKKIWLGVLLTVALSSCLTNKKFALLQKDDVNKDKFKTDSVYRHYTIPLFEYHIQPADIVSVRFESNTDKEFDFFSRSTSGAGAVNVAQSPLLGGDLVDPDGNIEFPVLGKVNIGGLTIFQVQEKLKKLASQYLDSPIVKVRLLNLRVTMLGEANREGTTTFPNNRVTMLEAIAQGGGFSDVADRENVKLIRQKGDTVEVLYLNFLKEDFINSPYYYVHQNDILVIPPLKQRPLRKYAGNNLGLVVSVISLILLTLSLSNNKL
jgi:polysaccharide biosynthesis/export protein